MKALDVVVANVVLPATASTLPLYVDGDSVTSVTVRDRHCVAVLPSRTASFGSYFNAFPASYWRNYARTDAVRLRLTLEGDGIVVVWRSSADGTAVRVASEGFVGGAQLCFDLELNGFEEGGALWFDVTAGARGAVLRSGEWSVRSIEERRRTCTVGIATFNRPSDCLRQLHTLATGAELDAVVDRVVVVDQGTDNVHDCMGFSDVARELGHRLTMIQQANLGGSGGFSRAMLETLRAGESDYVLLLDDDAINEPEAILRSVRFAEFAKRPLIVGGGMLHLDKPHVLYAQSERWDDRIGWVDLTRADAYDHDFVANPFRQSPFFHRLQKADFNGWWMCLVPVPLIAEMGLAMPLFLKGDDVEFALRAREHGIETVSVPGIAVWHQGWEGKAPTQTWEAYFLHRNRLITELLHSPRRRPSTVILHSFLGDMKSLLSLQYSVARLRALAVADVFDARESLPEWLATRSQEVRSVWSAYPDAIRVTPAPVVATTEVSSERPNRMSLVGRFLLTCWRHMFVRESRRSRVRPDMATTAAEVGWWTFCRADSAVVETPSGDGHAWYQRNRSESRRALRRSIANYARLWCRWPHLSAELKEASAELASPEQWSRVFAR